MFNFNKLKTDLNNLKFSESLNIDFSEFNNDRNTKDYYINDSLKENFTSSRGEGIDDSSQGGEGIDDSSQGGEGIGDRSRGRSYSSVSPRTRPVIHTYHCTTGANNKHCQNGGRSTGTHSVRHNTCACSCVLPWTGNYCENFIS